MCVINDGVVEKWWQEPMALTMMEQMMIPYIETTRKYDDI